jgi:hypothetical protein
MTLPQQIKTAIGNHGIWKSRLNSAIEKESSEFSAATVRCDDQCEFGKWLKTVDPSMKISSSYRKCSELHSRFHGAAANVLDLVAAGKKEAARQSVAAGGEFAKTSSSLTVAMMDWARETPL